MNNNIIIYKIRTDALGHCFVSVDHNDNLYRIIRLLKNTLDGLRKVLISVYSVCADDNGNIHYQIYNWWLNKNLFLARVSSVDISQGLFTG